MKLLGKVLVISGVAVAGAAIAVYVVRSLRARATESAGSMFVGAIDEVELSGPMRAGQDPLGSEPEVVPSEHPEINELRNKMPFG